MNKKELMMKDLQFKYDTFSSEVRRRSIPTPNPTSSHFVFSLGGSRGEGNKPNPYENSQEAYLSQLSEIIALSMRQQVSLMFHLNHRNLLMS